MSKWSFDKLLDGEISKDTYPNWIFSRSHPSSVGMHTRVTTLKPTSKNK
jgi:hypothetical protein